MNACRNAACSALYPARTAFACESAVVLVTVEDEVVVVVEPLCAAGVELHALANSPRHAIAKTVVQRHRLSSRFASVSGSRIQYRAGVAARHKGTLAILSISIAFVTFRLVHCEFSQVEPLSRAADRKPDRVGG